MNVPEADLFVALRPIVAAFQRLGVEYFVGGSVASGVLGEPRQTLDLAYLRDWAARLGLTDDLQRACTEAGLRLA